MSDGPRILLDTGKFRVVELANGNKVIEKADGADALGVERWRDLKLGEADRVAVLLRDWIFAHVVKCDLCQQKEIERGEG
jgi:hypothetical protein